jgi:hypothetical protein
MSAMMESIARFSMRSVGLEQIADDYRTLPHGEFDVKYPGWRVDSEFRAVLSRYLRPLDGGPRQGGNGMSDTPARDLLYTLATNAARNNREATVPPTLIFDALREARSTPAEALREALEHVLDVWAAPSPEEFARLHRVLTGHDSCSPHNREADR